MADLDAAAKTLNDALNALEKKAVLDYTLIDQILAKANALRTADFGKAGQDTIAALKAKALETKDAADDAGQTGCLLHHAQPCTARSAQNCRLRQTFQSKVQKYVLEAGSRNRFSTLLLPSSLFQARL